MVNLTRMQIKEYLIEGMNSTTPEALQQLNRMSKKQMLNYIDEQDEMECLASYWSLVY